MDIRFFEQTSIFQRLRDNAKAKVIIFCQPNRQ
jgi:hypothetical protein